jgi:hypothetical protein
MHGKKKKCFDGSMYVAFKRSCSSNDYVLYEANEEVFCQMKNLELYFEERNRILVMN